MVVPTATSSCKEYCSQVGVALGEAFLAYRVGKINPVG